MNLKSIFITIIFAVIIIGGGIWLFTDDEVKQKPADSHDKTILSEGDKKDDGLDPEPEISKSGPYPKLVIEESEYQFGIMGVKEVKTHEFIIKNEGEVPLQLARGKTTCQCTLSELEQKEILPGKTGKIKVTWEAKKAAKIFRHTARIKTNDPEYKEVKLVISGSVEPFLHFEPKGQWKFGLIQEGNESEFTGKIFTRTNGTLEFLEHKISNENIKADIKPLTEEELTKLDAMKGYSVHLKISPEITVGAIKEYLMLKMNVNDQETGIRVILIGNRFGPIRIIRTNQEGAKWFPEHYLLKMGTFSASEGKSISMPMYVLGMNEEFKVTNIESDLEFVNVSITKSLDQEADSGKSFLKENNSLKDSPDPLKSVASVIKDITKPSPEKEPEDQEKKEGKKKKELVKTQRFEIKFEVKPGSPPKSVIIKNAVKIRFTTNHPKMKFIDFRVSFVSI